MKAFWTAFGLGMVSFLVAGAVGIFAGPGLGFVVLAVCAGIVLSLKPVTLPRVVGLATGIGATCVIAAFVLAAVIVSGIG